MLSIKVLVGYRLYAAKSRSLFFTYLQNFMFPIQECHEQANTKKAINFSNKFKYKMPGTNKNIKDPYSQTDESMNDYGETAVITSDDLMIGENEVIRSRSKKKKKNHKCSKGEILFGIHPVYMALKHQRREFYKLFLKQDDIERKGSIDGHRLEIKNLAIKLGIEVTNIDVWKMNTLAPGCVHQGVCLNASKFSMMEYEDIRNETKYSSEHLPLWLVLDGIQDPMNVGAIIRTAYYFGVNKIFISKHNSCSLSPIVSKASSGALEVVDIFQILDLAEFLQTYMSLSIFWSYGKDILQLVAAGKVLCMIVLNRIKNLVDRQLRDEQCGFRSGRSKKNDGWSVLSTIAYHSHQNGGHTDCSIIDVGQYNRTKPIVLLLGNEGKGIAPGLQDICENMISILPKDNHNCEIDSLNVSVATGCVPFCNESTTLVPLYSDLPD